MTDVAELTEPSATARPAPDECRAAFVRVSDSAGFRSAPRLGAFLRFIVDATLSGRSETLKAYTIAVGALGRPHDFNPATDAIVRVEAGRLRTALGRYYIEGGGSDPIRIDLPRGCYVPEFRWNVPTSQRPEVLDIYVGLTELMTVRARNAVLFQEHRELRKVLARNLEVFKVNLRALEKSVGQALDQARSRQGATEPAEPAKSR